MVMNLFDDVDDTEDISKITTNTEFAKRYEHNKKREELQKLDELKKKGLVGDSESDSEESDEGIEAFTAGKKDDLAFIDALIKIKNKDPIINQKDRKLFESDDDESEDGGEIDENKTKKGKKPMYLKDVIARNLLENGAEMEEDDDEEEGKSRGKSYVQEQDEIRKSFLDAVGEEDDDDDDLLVEKKRSDGEDEDEDDEVHKKMDEYFGIDEDDAFLKKFLSDRMWEEKDKGKKPYNDDLDALSDEEELEKADRYEAEYNHRFEEGAGDRVLGHARFTEGSVRKTNNARKLQRKNKEERIELAKQRRKEELKHMKNLKKKEIEEKLEKIRAIAGLAESETCPLNDYDLDEEFDPEEYDRKMKETFDVGYYDKEDVDPGFGSDVDELGKPDFDKEDELLGLPKDWEIKGSGDGFAAAREKFLKRKTEDNDTNISVDGEEAEEELPGESKRKRKRKIPLREKLALDNDLEEYYKLDYEDTIGDLKTRFKYTSVPSQRYGLNKAEILMMDEKELNQYVPLKKLAPYRETEWKVPNSKRHQLKLKNKSLGKTSGLKDQRSSSKHKRKHDDSQTSEEGAVKPERTQTDEETEGDAEKLSRKTKRKRRQADLKLSFSRLQAYGINKKKSR
ncbi:hypothetical protein ACHQM5_019924 [Ranunculus cassubicifolius]